MKKLIVNCQTNEISEIDLTSEEISNRETNIANETARQQELETAKQAKEADQASGNQKLLDLGLSQAEATALTGYTPPVADPVEE
jgi:FMN-dependent NADH-azoreductase